MQESLQSARNVHHLIVIISVIILVIAFKTKRISDPYHTAYHRISRLEDTLKKLAVNERIKFSYKDGDGIAIPEDLLSDIKGHQKYLLQHLDSQKERSNTSNNLKQRRKEIEHLDHYSTHYNPDSIKLGYFIYAAPKYLGYELFDEISDEYPRFEHFQITYADTSVSSMRRILDAKSEEFDSKRNGNIDFLGLSVAVEDTYLIAPAVCLALQFFLISLMVHIFRNIKQLSDADEVLAFPWILLFEDWYSFVIYLVPLLLPMLASSSLINKSDIDGKIKDEWSLICSIAFSTLAVVIFIAARKILRKAQSVQKNIYVIRGRKPVQQ